MIAILACDQALAQVGVVVYLFTFLLGARASCPRVPDRVRSALAPRGARSPACEQIRGDATEPYRASSGAHTTAGGRIAVAVPASPHVPVQCVSTAYP